MAWKATHPDSTEWHRLPEEEVFDEAGRPVKTEAGVIQTEPVENAVRFELGFWPPRVSERLSVLFGQLQKPDEEIKISDPEYAEQLGVSFETMWDAVKYGCRGWEAEDFDPVTASTVGKETIDGREHTVLSDDSLRFLQANRLLAVVFMRCMLFNVLTEEKKREFGLRSSLHTTRSSTSAQSASQNGKASLPLESYDSEAASSTGVPSS